MDLTSEQEIGSTAMQDDSEKSMQSAASSTSSTGLSLGESEPASCPQGSNLSRENVSACVNDGEESGIQKPTRIIKNKTELIIIICMALMYFVSMCAYSMIAPFFAPEAKAKGSNGTITGLIFAVYPLIVFLFSPIVGKYIPAVGVRFTLIAGIFIEGSTEILFGFVADMPSGIVFIVFCFLIRAVTALGTAMSSTAILSIVSVVFKPNLATVMGSLEIFSGIGLMAGPAVGGALYGLGGFRLPFITMGVAVLCNLFVIWLLLPGDEAYQGENLANREPGSLTKALSIPGVVAIACVTTSGGLLLSFLDPTLSFHVQSVAHDRLTKSQIGLVFLIAPAIYTLAAPMFGAVADKWVPARFLIMGGHFVVAISYFLIGPSPLVTSFLPPRLWLTSVSLGVLGVGIAPFIIPGLVDMQSSAKRAGLPQTLASDSMLSGIFTGTFYIGGVIGPTLGGTLVEHMSFNWAATIFSLLIAVEGVLLLIFTIWERNIYFRRYSLLVTEADGIESDNCKSEA